MTTSNKYTNKNFNAHVNSCAKIWEKNYYLLQQALDKAMRQINKVFLNHIHFITDYMIRQTTILQSNIIPGQYFKPALSNTITTSDM